MTASRCPASTRSRGDARHARVRLTVLIAVTCLVALLAPTTALAAPVTSPIVTPAAPPAGTHGWYTSNSVVSIALVADDPTALTWYKWDVQSSWSPYLGDLFPQAGKHTLTYYSSASTGDETPQTLTIRTGAAPLTTATNLRTWTKFGPAGSPTAAPKVRRTFLGWDYASVLDYTYGARCVRFNALGQGGDVSPPGMNSQAYDCAIEVFGGLLYAASDPHGGTVRVWRTSDGTNWSEPTATPFGPTATGLTGMGVLGGYLYAVVDEGGSTFRVWRTADGVTWLPTSPNNIDGDPYNTPARPVSLATATFGGTTYLYVVTQNSSSGTHIYRTSDGSAWQPIVTDGFDNSGNDFLAPMYQFGGVLYASMGCMWTSGHGTIPGGDLWSSTDGVNFTPITLDGFGDPDNMSIMCQGLQSGAVFVGTSNAAAGGQVWSSANGADWTKVASGGLGDPANGVDPARMLGCADTGDGRVLAAQFNIFATPSSTPQMQNWVLDPAWPAPVTTVTVSPPTPSGHDGWYTMTQAPTIGLSADQAGSSIEYQWDAQGSGGWLPYVAALTPPTGTHTLYFRSSLLGVYGPVDSLAIKAGLVGVVNPPAPLTWTHAVANGNGDANAWFPTSQVVCGDTMYTVVALKNGQGSKLYSTDGGPFVEVDLQGAGLPASTRINDMLVHNGALVLAISSGVWTFDGAVWTSMPALGHSADRLGTYGGYLYAAGWDGSISRSNGGAWEPVVDGASGGVAAVNIDAFEVFDSYLYATGNGPAGTQVWRTQDGTNWTQVNEDGFGYPETNWFVQSAYVLGDKLYVGTWGGTSNGQVWRTANGTQWEPVTLNAFGGPDHSGQAMAEGREYQGAYYVMIVCPTGSCRIYRSVDDGRHWTQVNEDGFGDSNTMGVPTLTVFDGRLWAGTQNETDGFGMYTLGTSATYNGPSCTAAVHPATPGGADGWYTESQHPQITVSSDVTGWEVEYQWDAQTPGAWSPYSGPVDALAGIHTLCYRSTLPGSYGPIGSIQVKAGAADIQLGPVATPYATPAVPDGDDGWYTTTPTVGFTTDRPAVVKYRVRAGIGTWSPLQTFTPGVTPDVPWPQEGVFTTEYYAQDAQEVREDTKTIDGMLDATPPTVVSGLTTSDVEQTSVRLTWDPSTDAVSGMRGYGVAGFADGLEVVTLSAGAPTTYVVTGLQPGTTYTFRIRARDIAGNLSDLSSGVVITTPGAYEAPVSTGSNVTVSVPVGAATPVTVTFPTVSAAGQISVTPVAASSAAPPLTNFHVVGSDYYDITPTATFSGRARVTLPYDPAAVGAEASELRMMHYNTHVAPAAWEDITISVDTVNHTVTGETDSFSDFGLFLPDGSGGASSVPASSDWSLLLIVAGALSTVALRRRSEGHAI